MRRFDSGTRDDGFGDFDEIRREADARRLGAVMYKEAVRISPEVVEDVAAVLTVAHE